MAESNSGKDTTSSEAEDETKRKFREALERKTAKVVGWIRSQRRWRQAAAGARSGGESSGIPP